MRQSILISLMMLGFLSASSKAMAAVDNNQKKTITKSLKKQRVTKTTVGLKPQKPSKVAGVLKSKKGAKLKKNQSPIASKPQKKLHRTIGKNQQYWSVQCRNGFIKDNYVYCSRANPKIANVSKSKTRKLASHKNAPKANPAVKR